MNLKISNTLEFPIDSVTQTIAVYGMKGMGKTVFGAVLAEELYRCGQKFSYLDPIGPGYGLRYTEDGRSQALKILVLGGKHGDLPIEPTGGSVVADLVCDEAISTVVDISRRADGKMWSNGEKIRFVADYCSRLYERQGEKSHPIMQIIDEAGRFVPQSIPHGAVDIARCVGAIEQVTELGRNVGVGVCLITQRSARMNKSVSELAECMIAFRTIGPNSVDSITDWLGEHIPREKHKQMVEDLRSLPKGQALIVSPGWLHHEGIVSIRMRRTFDSSATPTADKRITVQGQTVMPDLEKYRKLIASTVERAKEHDVKHLQQQILQLKAELQKKERGTRVQAIAHSTPTVSADAKRIMSEMSSQIRRMEADRAKVLKLLDQYRGDSGNRLETLTKHVEVILHPLQAITVSQSLQTPAARPVASLPVRRQPTNSPPIDPPDGELTGPEQRILNAIAWLNSIGIQDPNTGSVAFLAGYTVNTGSYNNSKGSLRTKGLVTYPQPSRISLTPEGRQYAVTPEGYLNAEEIQKAVLKVLPGPEKKILHVLIDCYPQIISRAELAAQSGYTDSTGSFNNASGRLHSLGLVDYVDGGRRANGLLFLQDAP